MIRVFLALILVSYTYAVPSDAHQSLLKASAAGEAYASFAIGLHYRKGIEGVNQDDAKAREWWQKASRQGHALAAYNLGFMHLNGLGGAEDKLLAYVYLKLAGDQWVSEASELLEGLQKKLTAAQLEKALELLEAEKFQKIKSQSISAGDEYRLELASRYLHGQGTDKNLDQALDLYLEAARSNQQAAQFAAGFLLEEKKRISGYEEALYWYKKAAEKGDPRAQYRLGALYFRGTHIARDLALSYGWTRLAAEQELPSAKAALEYLEANISPQERQLGQSLSDGGPATLLYSPMSAIAIPPHQQAEIQKATPIIPSPGSLEPNDPFYPRFSITYEEQEDIATAQGLKWATSAANSGSAKAQVLLGERYHRGLGVIRDFDKAAYWYSKAMEQNDPKAFSNLAYMQVRVGQSRDPEGAAFESDSTSAYAKGVEAQYGINRDVNLKAAQEFYREGVRVGHVGSLINLALMLIHGLGGEAKVTEGKALLEQASKSNSTLASHLLRNLSSMTGTAEVHKAPAVETPEPEIKEPEKSLETLASEGNPNAQWKLGEKLLAEGEADRARELLEKALNQGIEEARSALVGIIVKAGSKAFETFDNIKAIEDFQKAMALDPKSFEVLHGLSRAFDSRGQDLLSEEKRTEAEGFIKSSLEIAEKLKAQHPGKGETWVMMAIATGNLAKFLGGQEKVKIGSKVEEYCKKAIEVDPSQGMAYSVLATYYLAISELPWLLKSFAKTFLGALPDVSQEDALELYRKGVKASPELIYANFKLAQLLQKMGKKDEAREYLNKALTIPARKSQETRTLKAAKALMGEL